MYKMKLQQLCQRYSMALPEYTTVKDGPNHNARFTATVTVNGTSFQSPPSQCRSTKDAQNTAALYAFEYFTANPPVIHNSQPSATILPDPASSPAAASSSPPFQSLSPSLQASPAQAQSHVAASQPAFQSLSPPPAPTQTHAAASPPSFQSLSPPLQQSPAPAPVEFASDLSFLPPQLQQLRREPLSSASARYTGPQPVHPSLLQQTQIQNTSSPPKNSTEVGQSKEISAQTPVVTQSSSEELANVKGMYKSKLLELCRKHSWTKPEYMTEKEGPDHNPRFGATVIVNGISFKTPDNQCRSSKEATNLAAHIAFDHFSTYKPTVLQQCQLSTSPSSSGHTKNEKADQSNGKNAQTFESSSTPLVDREVHKSSDIQFLYKNQLQQYAQKLTIAFPEYTCEIEGPPHARRFRGKVDFCGKTFESQEFFTTLKEAEQAAAKVALEALSPAEIPKGVGLYKTLLQQLAQKQFGVFPVYKTIQSGPPHSPTFVATVEVDGETFQGEEAKSKKQAEMNAAEVAYNSCMKCTTDIGSKKQRTSGMHVHSQPCTDNRSQLPFERSTNCGVKYDLENPSESNVKETDKIVVSLCNSNVAGNASNLSPIQASNAPTLEHLTSSIKEFGLKTPAVRDMVLVYPRGSEEILPENASILPCTTKKWMAVEVELSNDNGNGN